ncbi:MAG: TetR/AcrR family transcriptional regulator [Solirubrobacteraceae bacterium]
MSPKPRSGTHSPQRRLPAEQRRTKVLEAGRRAFVASGFGGATMRSIAADAGIDQAMVYRFFESKEKLFEEAIATPLQEAVDHMRAMSLVPSDADGAYDVREHSLDAVRDLIRAMREIAPLLGVVLTIDEATSRTFYRERFEPSLNQIRDVLLANIALLPHRDLDPDLVVRVVIGTSWFLAIDERFGTSGGSGSDDAAVGLTELILDGLIARADKAP